MTHKARWLVPAAGSDDKTIGSTAVSNKTYPLAAEAEKCSLHVVGGAGFTGTPKLFASNDYDPQQSSVDPHNGTWEDVSAKLVAPMTAPTGSAFSYLMALDGLPFRHFYFDLTYSSGAGSTVRATFTKNQAG